MSTSRSAGLVRLRHVTFKPPFEAVVAEHGATVLRVCRAVLGPADADDAWSETFLAALKAYPELPADANVEAWLVTIAHRKAIDVTRAAARRAVPVGDVPEPPAAQHGGGGVGSDGRDLDLAGALAGLPRRQREAVAYHYLAGLPYAEVAAVTGGSTDAARRAAADGIARLRKTYPGGPAAAPEDGETGETP
jgi:RNA polymerase sigma factor (sigma-70 family)